MPIPQEFTQATDWKSLDIAVHSFGKSNSWTEDDLLMALNAIKSWRKRFADKFVFEFQGEQIFWGRYESLVWALGEQFHQVLSKNKPLRKSGRFFEAVQAICFEKKFGKGRESFTMLLGQYGGASQIPALIRLLDDPQVSGHAIYSLRLLGAAEAADKVRPFLDESKAWVKQEARKFFQKIEPKKK